MQFVHRWVERRGYAPDQKRGAALALKVLNAPFFCIWLLDGPPCYKFLSSR
jgi:hypothetical protein